ncbi:MAG TPA: hypothetical protein VF841_00300 [Anaeromyxobacter sp.]
MPGAARLAAVVATLACAIAAARADDATPVSLEAGQALNLCRAGLVACPASASLCDDPKVARVENGPDGAELKAGSPGTTLCSVLGPGRAFRRVLRVTVTAPAAKPR